MNIRFYKTTTGKMFTVYAVKNTGVQVGYPVWSVLCGRSNKKPVWRPLNITQHGRPYFWVDGAKLYLEDFKKMQEIA